MTVSYIKVQLMKRVYEFLRATGRDELVGLPETALNYNIRGTSILKGSWELGNLTSIGWRRIGDCIFCDDFARYKFTFRDEAGPLLAAFILSYPSRDELFVDMLHALELLEKIEMSECYDNMDNITKDTLRKLQETGGRFWRDLGAVPAIQDKLDTSKRGWIAGPATIWPEVAPCLQFSRYNIAAKWIIGTIMSAYDLTGRTEVIPELNLLYYYITGAHVASTPAAPSPPSPAQTATIDGITSNIVDTLASGINRETFAAHLGIFKVMKGTDAIIPPPAAALCSRLAKWANIYADCITSRDYVNPAVIGLIYRHPDPEYATVTEQELANALSTRVYGGAFKIPKFGTECMELLKLIEPDACRPELM